MGEQATLQELVNDFEQRQKEAAKAAEQALTRDDHDGFAENDAIAGSAAFGGFVRLGVMLDMPSATVRRIANPKGIAPTGTFAIRLAAVAKVPVEVLLGGKVVVTTPIIGRAA